MKYIWVSYSGKDRELVESIEDELAASNKARLKRYCWVDESNTEDSSPRDNDLVYYLRYGENIGALVDEICSSYRVLVILSQSYFESDVCLRELAGILLDLDNKHVIAVGSFDQDASGYLEKDREFHFKVDADEPPKKMSLAKALSEVSAREDAHVVPFSDVSEAYFRTAIEKFGRMFLPSKSSALEIGKAIRDGGNDRSEEARRRALGSFKEWCSSGVAAEFSRIYGLDEAAESIVNSLDEIKLNTHDGSKISLYDALNEFLKKTKLDHWPAHERRGFVGVLCGFMLLPLVRKSWLDENTNSNGGYFFVTLSSKDELLGSPVLHAPMAYSAWCGGGMHLTYCKNEEKAKVAGFVHLEQHVESPSSQEQSALSPLQRITSDLWCYAYGKDLDEFKKVFDGGVKIGLRPGQVGRLKKRLTDLRSTCGGGSFAFVKESKVFSLKSDDRTLWCEFLEELNFYSERKLTIDLLVYRKSGSDGVLVSFDDYWDRLPCVEKILEDFNDC